MYHAIVFLPLVGFLIAGVFGRFLGARASEVVTTALLFLSCALSWIAFVNVGFGAGATRIQLGQWFASGDMVVDWAFRVDTLTAVMLIVVTTVSAFVHLYSIGYMHEDPHRPRFFAYLSLFTFAMLMLVTADNLVQMFFGWEGVGLASYLLIGFWYEKDSARAAAIKAFIVNRVGDFGFALGIFLVFVLFNSVAFDGIFPRVGDLAQTNFRFLGFEWHALTLACLLLFMGAMGKSAQFLLHTWLPDAMEGPTPVSALIHAATMVTAGVFMVARLSPLFEAAPGAQTVVIVIGATTAFFAATVGLVQNDIKRVVAYSTCSQLGYMFVGLGVGAYSAGIFHLFTHAFFKALLFLGSGSVIMAMHHEQDIRNMGGLRRHIPFTAAMFAIGTLALTGFPFTAGYFSKDAIIEASYVSHRAGAPYAFLCVVIAAFMTSFYSWRLYFLTFEGQARWGPHGHAAHEAHPVAHGAPPVHEGVEHDERGRDVEPAEAAPHEHGAHDHTPHESPLTILIPLAVLALGSLVAGFAAKEWFIGHSYDAFWKGALATAPDNKVLEEMHHVPLWVALSPSVMMALGFALAYAMYIRDPRRPARLAAEHPVLYRFLLNKWYFDELYDLVFVRLGPDGISARVIDVTRGVVRLQSGYVYHYAFVMLIGVAILITWYMTLGGGWGGGGAH
jgi:NADH-quinone oxidoreductase subunit L